MSLYRARIPYFVLAAVLLAISLFMTFAWPSSLLSYAVCAIGLVAGIYAATPRTEAAMAGGVRRYVLALFFAFGVPSFVLLSLLANSKYLPVPVWIAEIERPDLVVAVALSAVSCAGLFALCMLIPPLRALWRDFSGAERSVRPTRT